MLRLSTLTRKEVSKVVLYYMVSVMIISGCRISFTNNIHCNSNKVHDKITIVITESSHDTEWMQGSRGVISLHSESTICQIINPSGVIVATSREGCNYVVNVATIQHEGVWLARYNMYGMLEAVEQKFRVMIVDQIDFNANVSYTEDNKPKLFCQIELNSIMYSQSCSFVRPDGMTLYMAPIIGTERYTAYINTGSKNGSNKNFLECGLIIEEIQDIDYGAWRCDLRIKSKDRPYGYVLHVDRPNNTNVIARPVKIKTDDVYVKRGDPFTIKCIADTALKYCWLQSPNGTTYSITQDKNVKSSFVLRYAGSGLSLGECGAEISTAENTDPGQWSCFMGVVDGAEKTATVSVTVTESYLMAERSEIAVNAPNDPVLSCHILPRTLDRTVHYCRWIRPDGYGIYNDISHRYTTNSNHTHCRLVILNYYSEEDDGLWTCVAGLTGENGILEENWTHIRMRQLGIMKAVTIVGIIMGTTVLLLALIGTFGYMAFRKRRVIPSNPPSYSSEDYYPPKSFQPKFDQTESQY